MLATLNPYTRCPEQDPEKLAALYDNNSDARNQADLRALQACSAEAFASSRLKHTRVVWGTESWQWVDLFQPVSSAGCPSALVFVHGGRWELNTSRETSFWAQACADAGIGFIAINFQPLSSVGLANQVNQVVAALNAIQRYGPSHGLEMHRLALAGHSSGAHLALCALLDNTLRVSFQGAILLGGIYDLEPLSRTQHNHALGFTKQIVQTLSPLGMLSQTPESLRLPPIMVGVGAQESSEFLRQAHALHVELQARTSSVLETIDAAAHFDAALSFTLPDSKILAFAEQALGYAEMQSKQ